MPADHAAARTDSLTSEVKHELLRAVERHKPLHSAHEAIAVIWEEFEELKAHVWKDTGYSGAARHEAVQIAAMALRYVMDLRPGEVE